jgi:SET domain-containing protein
MNEKIVVKNTRFGLGLISKEKIKKGEVVWKITPKNVILYNEEECIKYLNSIQTDLEKKFFLDYTLGIKDKLCFILDDGKYMNHSLSPNCFTDMDTIVTYALRDIEVGEELFEDYRMFDHPPFLYNLLEKYNCFPDYYEVPPNPNTKD